MLSGLVNYIKEKVGVGMEIETIEEALNINTSISDEMIKSIELWNDMYMDKSPWIKKEKLKSLNIASAIASEIAMLVTIEIESEITASDKSKNANDKARAEFLNQAYQRVIENIQIQTEYAAAKGGIIFKPFVVGENIAVDFVQADEFIPIEFNSQGELIGVVFPEVIRRNGFIYTRLEYHHLVDEVNGVYYISNTSFKKELGKNGLGIPVELTEVKEWEDLETEVNIYNIYDPLFSYFKMPLANNKDTRSHIGASIYSRSENIIKEIDRQHTRVMWEYEGTELAIDVSLEMLENATELPKGKDRLFRKLDSQKETFYEVFSPQIRDESLYNGLDKLLQRLEFNCGLAYGTLSDIKTVEKTAEEIKSSKQRSHSTITGIQKHLQTALEHLIRSMDYLTTMYGLAPVGEYETSFHFDDSIIIDSKSEQAIMLQEVAAGLIKPEYYLEQRYGVTEEQAMEMLPGIREPNQAELDNWE